MNANEDIIMPQEVEPNDPVMQACIESNIIDDQAIYLDMADDFSLTELYVRDIDQNFFMAQYDNLQLVVLKIITL